MLKRPDVFHNGWHLTHLALPPEVRTAVEQQNWQGLDEQFKLLTAKDGSVYHFLQSWHDFSSIEFIISIRDAENDWEEDGIWHDDGSRVFAFSLSLTPDTDQLKGGRLGFRKIGDEPFISIPTPSYGGIILFLTGIYGYEHKIHKVEAGRRIIIAGWCS